MALDEEIKKLDDWIELLPKMGMEFVNSGSGHLYLLDFIFIGAIKRTLSMAVGLSGLIKAKNITLCRAVIRMQMDTVSRMLAYTYVDDPSKMALEVIKGKALNKFHSKDGKPLTDAYLIDRISKDHPWMKESYKRLSGYVHFSENQLFDSIVGVGSEEERTINISIATEDSNFPEVSWIEIVQSFVALLSIFGDLLVKYRNEIRELEAQGSKT